MIRGATIFIEILPVKCTACLQIHGIERKNKGKEGLKRKERGKEKRRKTVGWKRECHV